MATTGLQAFNAAGYLSANQEKAGERWSGLLYSITSLPAVMVGTAGVYLTGQILDYTHQDWSVVFALNAAIFLLGSTSFVALYDSKREFD
jgi:MFS transporter, ACS family, solute carrier family 17 (sodium-dependent inorganic phosphate cotransporter), other